MALLSWGTALLLLQHVANAVNMNGEYTVTNSLTYSTKYEAEYFEVYSPLIRTLYSEVFWKFQDPVVLPPAIVERFSGKVMAIVGYEVDQVQLADDGGKDKPVPVTWAYNHHYSAWLLDSNKAKIVKKSGQRPGTSHGKNEHWAPVALFDSVEEQDSCIIPSSTWFSEGNGGEWRKSYHGYPKKYAQLLQSPDTFSIIPMQIDTWNRDTKGAAFVPGGPLPQNSHIPQSAGYSGLIECPCSTRVPVSYSLTYALVDDEHKTCTASIANASECHSVARLVVPSGTYVNKTIQDSSQPNGCFVVPHPNGSTDLVWNKAQSHGSSELVEVATEEEYLRFVAFAQGQVNVTVDLNQPSDVATITLVGPDDRWFGVGFGSSSMCLHMVADVCPLGGPYAIVVAGDDYDVVERKLDFHGPGKVLPTSVQVVSNTGENGIRTVVLARSLTGFDSNYYTFDPSNAVSVPIIAAQGCDQTFSQHCSHGPSELNFLAVDSPAQICEAGISGTIGGNQFSDDRCAPFPKGDLKRQHNPTCSVETYRGGLSCCHDGQSLLDKDQEVPWPDQYLEYQLKFRFYFEEYHPASKESLVPSHHNLVRLYWQTESNAGEYDIVKCKDGAPHDQCVQVIMSRWKVRDMMNGCSLQKDSGLCTGEGSTDSNKTAGVRLIYAGPHCHAPSCLSMELYNADTGELLCGMEPVRGQSDQVYDENGFLAIPPCLWGDVSEGLLSPELLSLDTALLSIKRNNSTMGHTGEMASWQMRGVVIPKESSPGISTTGRTPQHFVSSGRRSLLRHGEDSS
jgi:hypothetical protein